MNLPYIIKSCLCLFVLTIAFGCEGENKSSIHPEKVESKQLMEGNSAHTNEANVVAGLHATYRHEVDSSDSEVTQFVTPVWHKELASAFYLVFK